MPRFAFPKSLLFTSATVLLAIAPLCPAGTAPTSSLLPHALGSFTCSEVVDDAHVNRVPSLAALQQEAGIMQSEVCNYGSGEKRIHVHLDKYRDPSTAYEIYTASLTSGMNPSTVGELSGVDGNHFLMLVGNTVLNVDDHQNATVAELRELAKRVREHADQAPLPPIRTFLPQGLSDGTQRYAAGPKGFVAALDSLHRSQYAAMAPEIGFANSAEVMLAEYHKGRDAAVLLLIEYPTQHIAEQQWRHLQTVLPGIGGSEVKVVRKASLLSMVLGATSPEYAENLARAVNYETEVTWNEGSHVITDPPWVVVLSRIFVATGLFLVTAIVLGVAFGGVRILTKRFFPGKVFDRPQDIEVLQLGLGAKPIDPTDFYRR